MAGARPTPAPSQVGDYRIIHTLGQGGSATVFSAEHVDDGSPAAVKIADEASPLRTGWFRSEASLAARLRHPGIVRLLSSGTLESGRPYLVFERIDGPTLEQVADELDTEAIVSVGAQLLDALGYAHDAGVLHCDVKPDNVLVSAFDDITGLPRIKLADFGLAATRERGARPGAQTIPLIAGTPGFLSPEQARGTGNLTPSVDIYGAGALLYRLLAGFPPQFGVTSTQVLQRTLNEPPLPLTPRDDLQVPQPLVDLVHAMLARDAAYRPASAQRAKRVLLAAAGAPADTRSGARATATAEARLAEHTLMLGAADTAIGRRGVDQESATVAVPSAAMMPTPPAIPVARFARRSAAMLGREAAMEALVALLGPGAEARPGVVSLVGPPGAGRSRLARELAVRLESLGMRSHSVTGRLGTGSPPFEVLAALALEVAGAGGITSPWVAAEQLSRMLAEAGVAEEDTGRDALVAGVIGVGLPRAVGQVRMHAYRAFDKLLAHCGEERGGEGRVLLSVDDADEADEGSLAVLEVLARAEESRAPAPRVLLTRRRAAEGTEGPAPGATVSIDLLSPREATQMLAALMDREPAEVRALAEAVGGAPADLATAAVCALATKDDSARTLPALLDARLEITEPGLSALLIAAAVHGGDVPARALAPATRELDATSSDPASAEFAVQAAVLEGWLARVPRQAARLEPALRFTSEIARERILARAETDLRRRACYAAAAWLDRECLDGSEGMRAALGRLAEEAGALAIAAHAWADAGRVATSLRARAYLERALRLGRDDEGAAAAIDAPALLAQLSELATLEEPAKAEAFAREALELLEPERSVLRARLGRLLSSSILRRGRPAEALSVLEEAHATLGDDGDPRELASVLSEMGWILGYQLGRNEEGIALGRRALEVAARIDAPSFRASLCGRLGANYLRAGDWDGQLGANLTDLGLSARAGDVAGVIRAHINLGVCTTNRGLPAMARAHTEEALRLSLRYGHLHSAQIARNNLAMIAADDGRFEEAEREAEATLALAERTGMRSALGETYCSLARVRMHGDDLGGADAFLRKALEASDAAAERELAIRLGALVDLRRGESGRAEEALAGPLSLAEFDPYERANTWLVLAAVMRASGRSAEAEGKEREADAVYARLGADAAHERRRWALPPAPP